MNFEFLGRGQVVLKFSKKMSLHLHEHRLGWILLRPDKTFCVSMGNESLEKSKAVQIAEMYSIHERKKKRAKDDDLHGFSFLYFACTPEQIEQSDFMRPHGYVLKQDASAPN